MGIAPSLNRPINWCHRFSKLRTVESMACASMSMAIALRRDVGGRLRDSLTYGGSRDRHQIVVQLDVVICVALDSRHPVAGACRYQQGKIWPRGLVRGPGHARRGV